jgi:hypothetical protein
MSGTRPGDEFDVVAFHVVQAAVVLPQLITSKRFYLRWYAHLRA